MYLIRFLACLSSLPGSLVSAKFPRAQCWRRGRQEAGISEAGNGDLDGRHGNYGSWSEQCLWKRREGRADWRLERSLERGGTKKWEITLPSLLAGVFVSLPLLPNAMHIFVAAPFHCKPSSSVNSLLCICCASSSKQ